MFEINVTGVFMTAQAVARHMIKSGNGGSIVLIGSMSGTIANRVRSRFPIWSFICPWFLLPTPSHLAYSPSLSFPYSLPASLSTCLFLLASLSLSRPPLSPPPLRLTFLPANPPRASSAPPTTPPKRQCCSSRATWRRSGARTTSASTRSRRGTS